jgi:glycosyltransferase involved in cell wall biosynthesis
LDSSKVSAPTPAVATNRVADSVGSTLETVDRAFDEIQAITDANLARSRSTAIKKLSVLMPIYNERWTLEEILDRTLNSPVELELEIVAVDDGSTDGSWEVLQEMARRDSRILPLRHSRNRGKGAAIQTAITHITGDVAVIQDADLEYNPKDIPRLLEPILEGKADAVFGSRFTGSPRRVLMFWHSLANRLLTLTSNILNDLNLTDMETCYKAVRADVLRQLSLRRRSFTIEPELTCRLAQWGARIFEVPISYAGRTYQEDKKVRPLDAFKAIGAMLWCRLWDTRFTHHTGMYVLKSMARAQSYHRWTLNQCGRFLGDRVLEAGAGIGNLSTLLLDRQRLLVVDHDSVHVSQLRDRFGNRRNVRAIEADLTDPHVANQWQDEQLDTIFCSNVLEHLQPDEQVLQSFFDSLSPGGHCVIVVPANPRLYTRLDSGLGHYRRYTIDDLRSKMQGAGFQVVFANQFCKAGALAWWFNGRILRRSHLTPRQMIWFDRLWPLSRHLDNCLPVPGMSLMMVGQRES